MIGSSFSPSSTKTPRSNAPHTKGVTFQMETRSSSSGGTSSTEEAPPPPPRLPFRISIGKSYQSQSTFEEETPSLFFPGEDRCIQSSHHQPRVSSSQPISSPSSSSSLTYTNDSDSSWTSGEDEYPLSHSEDESFPEGKLRASMKDKDVEEDSNSESSENSASKGCLKQRTLCCKCCKALPACPRWTDIQKRILELRQRVKNTLEFAENADPEGPGCCALLLALVSVLLIIATLPLSLCMCIKVVQEYERSVIFRLGRLRKGGAKGPGIFFIIPCIDTYRKVDLRTVSFDVPPQEVLSRDSVTVTVDAVVYYRVSNPTMATNNVEDFSHSTHLLAATTLRNVLGTKHLAEILSERETISHVMEMTLDEATDPWGVKVERVEIKDVRLPVQLQRAMAAEAEAAREARAKVIAAEGEQKASRALREASDVISQSPSALQLRYLQTLNTISAEKNSTIIFPVPMDLISHFLNKKED